MAKLSLFLPLPKELRGQAFGNNDTPLYASQGLKGHTAEDWGFGWSQPIPNLAKDAYCYSVMNKDNANPDKYRAVFTLVSDTDGNWYEISYGHASDILAVPGQTYQPGDILMKCGNSGDVYAFGQKITKEQKLAGSKAGAHLHGPQIRPVKRIKTRVSSKKYLTDANGYVKKDGHYFEIIAFSNGYNGCVSAEPFYNGKVIGSTSQTSQKLEIGARGPHVTRFQSILQKLGYFPATQKLTDYYGVITTQAYSSFKASTGFIINIPNSTGGEGGASFDSMETETPPWYGFVFSNRFWALVGTSASATLVDPSFPTQPWYVSVGKFLGLLGAGFTIVRTVDRVSDKKVEAAALSQEG